MADDGDDGVRCDTGIGWIDRDFQRMLDLGGNVYFLSKIFASDGLSYVEAVSTMTEYSVQEYQAMMLAGGRSPDGWRSKSERTS